MLKKTLFGIVGLLFASPAFAADITLFDSQSATGPFGDEVVLTSAEIDNNNALDSIKITVKFETISPKPCTCQFVAVLQEEIATGVWSTLAAQHDVISSDDNAPTRIIELTPVFNANPGADEFIAVNGGTRISRTQGQAAAKMRLVIQHLQVGPTPGTDLTISAYARTFNTN